jgi:hypothetical protein
MVANGPERAVDPEDLEEVRLAVVMNGGVSLAVWIAGVTNEINRLQQQPPDRRRVSMEGCWRSSKALPGST